MKPGYYLDMFDDLVIVYPDQTYELYNISTEKFVLGSVKLEEHSGFLIVEFIGKL